MKSALALMAAGTVLVTLVLPPARGQEEPGDDNDALAPEVEAAFREFSKEAADSRREAVAAAVEKLAGELAREVKLDPASKEKLAEFYPGIIEATQAVWQDRFQAWLGPILKRSPDPAGMLEGWDAEQMARNPSEVWARPDRTRAWQEALDKVLNPAQQARYQANEKARQEKARQDLRDYLQASEDYVSQLLSPMMEAEVSRLERLAALDEARVKTLKATAEAVVKEIAKGWRESTESRIVEMEDDRREERVRNRHFLNFDPTAAENQPTEHEAWQEGVAKLLSDAEREEITKREEELREWRTQALAKVLIEVLDPYLGFTGDQRARLQPLLAKPLHGLPDYYFVSPRPGYSYPLNPEKLFAKVSGVAEGELRAVLDDLQMTRWLRLTPTDLARSQRISVREEAGEFTLLPEEEMDDLAVRRVVSRYLHYRSRKVVEKKAMLMEARADAVARVTSLSPEQLAVLRTAAKGAAQILAERSIQQLESWVRQNVQRVKPGDLAQRFKRLGGPYYYERYDEKDPELWTSAIERILSPQQREVWKTEREAAEAWQQEAQLAVVITELEKVVLLTAEQRAAMRDLVHAVLEDYRQDLDRMFSGQWHAQGYYCLVPLALLTDEQLASALDKEQISSLRGNFPGHFGDMVENLRKMHKQRVAEKP